MTRRLKPRGGRRRLPPLILVTDCRRLADPLLAAARLPRASAVILRDYDDPNRAALAGELARLARRIGLRLLIAGDPRLALAVGAGGVHLSEAMIAGGGHAWRRWRRPGWLVTAAAHSPQALRRAARAGADAALLSPVFPTASHPGRAELGPLRFAAWVQRSPIPVYALGGIDAVTARRLAGSGAVGLAAVAALGGADDQPEGSTGS